MNNKKFGAFIVISCAFLWAISGICGQLVFERSNLTTQWLTTTRMASTGVILLAISLFTNPRSFKELFKNKGDLLKTIIFSIVGCLLVQYSYFAAIKYANAATGTILQYVSPVIVVLSMAVINKKLPSVAEAVCCIMAVCGVFLVSTGGNLSSFSIAPKALVWGLISACSLAYYTVAPVKLVKKYGAMSIVGIGMFLGGIILGIATRPFSASIEGLDAIAVVEVLVIIIFGTVIPFTAYSKGVTIVGSAKSSILATSEPMAAFLISLFILGEKFPPLSVLGFLFIVFSVIFITLSGKKEKNEK